MKRHQNIFRSVDWVTIVIYLLMLLFGWVSVCGASYSFGDAEIFSLAERSGMQIVWIGAALVLALFLLLLDDRYYDTFAYVIYGAFIIVLFLTIFNPHTIKGSRSWIVLGPLHVQPAEFAKFATAIAVSKFMSPYTFNINRSENFYRACGIVLLPMLLIILQRETGSALVYIAFFLMFYREGMPGFVLFTGVAVIAYFVVGLRYEDVPIVPLADGETESAHGYVGAYAVYLMIQVFVLLLHRSYFFKHHKERHWLTAVVAATNLCATLVSLYLWAFNIAIVQCLTTVGMMLYLGYRSLFHHAKKYALLTSFVILSFITFGLSSFAMDHLLQPHQQMRVNVLLGLDDDINTAGYNVHQSKIAIGSGGFFGKGFLQGTQTKLHFVPEQDTDFIFCTIGEEQGFVGGVALLLLFLALILRLVYVAERQNIRFSRIYGYCVLSIFLFHLFINIGMVLGLTPVIGIPLPFFSYGGSSLLGFTILLFIFLRMDAARNFERM